MAFRFIEPEADGTFQYVLSRAIEDPDTIDLTDTPTNGVTGLWNGNLTGSKQSIEFEGVGERMLLPTSEGLGTEFLLDSVSNAAAAASGIMFETWMKIETPSPLAGEVLEWFDATIQRNELVTTVGYDGIYSNRLVYTDPEGDSSSAWYLDFQFAYDTNIALSLTSAGPIATDTWKHIVTMYTSGDPFNTGLLSIYVDGVLERSETVANLDLWGNPSLALPSTGSPLPVRESSVNFRGKLDEMRLWSITASDNAINELASLTSIGLYTDQADPLSRMFVECSPSADYCVGWWRFESISAFQIFASVPESVVDSTSNNHNATPIFFEGATDFSDEQHGIFGGASAFPLLRTGTPDNGGLLVLDNLNTTLTFEEGVQNLVVEVDNEWTASTGNESVTVDDKQIWTGTSGVRVRTFAADQGAIHDIDYCSEFLFDNNDYVCQLRLLNTSGSTSARVVFTLGHLSNSAAVTATTEKFKWDPVIIRNTVSADANETSITGRVTVQSLSGPAEWNIDALMLSEGTHPPAFVAPEDVRKSGQIYWEISD